MVIKTITIIIFCLLFLYDILLKVISLKSVANKIPDNVRDVYDRASYQKWQAYYREKLRLSLISESVSFLVELVLR